MKDLSYNQRRDLLQKAIYAHCSPYCYVMDVYDGYCVYQEWQESGMDMYRLDYKIKDDYSIKMGEPQKVIGVTSFQPINYSLFGSDTAVLEGEWVVRTGKIFECGEFPDKMFSLSEDEADGAIAGFDAVELDVEHMDTVFDGKLGKLTRVWRQGKELWGEVRLSKNIHELLDGEPLRVSCTWSRFPKRITALALVLQPRITDAVLMAAFSKENDTMHKEDTEVQIPLSTLERVLAMFGIRREASASVEETVAGDPAPVAPASVTEAVSEADFNQRVEAEIARRIEQASFQAQNESSVDALVAEFKVEPSRRDALVAMRATDAQTFDWLTSFLPVKAEFQTTTEKPAGTVDASTVLAQADGDPLVAEKLEANRRVFAKSGLYDM